MNNFHELLSEKIPPYGRWHEHPQRSLHHLAIFVAVSIVTTIGLVLSIQGSVSAAPVTEPLRQKAITSNVESLNEKILDRLHKYKKATAAGKRSALVELKSAIENRNTTLQQKIESDPAKSQADLLPSALVAKLPTEVSGMLEKNVDITGNFAVAIYDLENKTAETRYVLEDQATKKVYTVHFAKGTPRFQQGVKVRVRGTALNKQIVAADAENSSSIQVAQAAGGTVTAPVPAAAETPLTVSPKGIGTRKLLVLMLNFTDNTSQPYNAQQIKDIFFNNPDSINKYYQEASFGKMSVTGDVDPTYVTLAYPAQQICDAYYMDDAKAIALSHGYDFNAYENIVFLFPPEISCSGRAGWAYYPGPWSVNKYAWLKMYGGDAFRQLAIHELGHSFGGAHASTYSCGSKQIDVAANCAVAYEYGDNFDPLGYYNNKHSNVPHKAGYGWIPTANFQTITTNGTYTVAPLENTTGAVQLLRIDKPDTFDKYYIGYRQPVGLDSSLPTEQISGVSIYKWNQGWSSNTYMLDMTPGDGNFTNAPLSDGASFVDSINGITVKQLSHSAAGATLAVTFGAEVCAKQNPIISLAPITQTGPSNSSKSYTALIVNKDTAACPTSSFNISTVIPVGWSAVANPASVSLAPDGVGSATITVTNPSGTADGSYGFTARATSGSDSSKTASVDGTFVVYTEDITAPSVPANLTTSGITTTNITLTWSASTDNISVSGYNIYRDGIKVANVSSPMFTDTGLSPNTTYSYNVSAYDPSGNESAKSTVATAKTLSLADTSAPTVPTNVTSSAITSTTATISWSPSTDNVAVVGYYIYRNGVKVNTLSGSGFARESQNLFASVFSAIKGIFVKNASLAANPSYTDTGLAPDTSYTYTVSAYDAAGNESAQSSLISIRTLALPDTSAPTVPTGVVSSNITTTSATLLWNPSTDNVAVTGYNIYRNGVKVSSMATTTFVDTGLTPDTTYSYSVSAYDAAGNESAKSVAVSLKTLALPDTSAPTTPTNVTSSNITTSSVTLSWNPSTDNVGVVGYNVYRNGSKVGTVVGTSFVDSDLIPNTTYTYAISAYDAAGNESVKSSVASVKTLQLPDTSAPTVPANVLSSGITTGGVTVSWNSSADNVAVTGYNIYRNGTKVISVTGTSFTDSGLTPDTTYSYSVSAYDAAGNESAKSVAISVRTLPLPDTSAPTVPTGVVSSNIITTSATISWNPSTDNVAVVGYYVYRNGVRVNVLASPAAAAAIKTNTKTKVVANKKTATVKPVAAGSVVSTSFVDSGLTPDTTYSYAVSAYDAAGNESAKSVAISVKTLPIPDTSAPTVPIGLNASTVTSNSATLSWNPSTDNVGVVGYNVYRNGTRVNVPAAQTASRTSNSSKSWIGGVFSAIKGIFVKEKSVSELESVVAVAPATLFVDTNLTPDTTYSYSVSAYDAAGNESAKSVAISVRTLPLPDTSVPTVPTGVVSSNITTTSATLSWNPSTDNVGVAGYNVYRDSVKITSSDSTSFIDTNLSPDTNYSYVVSAYDAAGNESGRSTVLIVRTMSPPDTAAPTAPTALTSSNITTSSVTLSWGASTDNVGVVGYNVYRNGSKMTTVTSGTSFTDVGLSPDSVYTYSVSAFDAVGNESSQSGVVTIRILPLPDTSAPTVPTGVVSSNITTTSVTLSWNPSTDNVGVVGYNVYRNGTRVNVTASPNFATAPKAPAKTGFLATILGAIKSVFIKDKSVAMVGVSTSFTDYSLTPDTTYSYSVSAYDAAGNESGRSSALSVKTLPLPDTSAPTVPTNLNASNITTNGATLSWLASTDNVGVVGYNVYRNGSKLVSVSGTTYIDSSAAANTIYTYSVSAYDAAGNESGRSVDISVRTTTPPDTSAPTVPTGVVSSNITTTSATLSWNPSTDNVGVVGYNVYRNGIRISAAASVGNVQNARSNNMQAPAALSVTSFTDSGLTPDTAYSYSVSAYDGAGNESAKSVAVSLRTLPLPDTSAPTVPANLNASNITTNGATLSWLASTDNVGVVGYNVYRNGSKLVSVSGTTYIDSSAAANTIYTYSVSAYDAAGNESAKSVAISVRTLPLPDTSAPTVPTGVVSSNITTTSATLSWNPSTDNVGVVGYNVYRDSVKITTLGGTSFTDSSLTPDTTYSYSVSAYDAAGNESGRSSVLSVKTTKPLSTVSILSYSILAANRLNTVILTAKTSVPTTLTVRFGTSPANLNRSVTNLIYTSGHFITLVGLNPGSMYYYQVTATGRNGDTATSPISTFVRASYSR